MGMSLVGLSTPAPGREGGGSTPVQYAHLGGPWHLLGTCSSSLQPREVEGPPRVYERTNSLGLLCLWVHDLDLHEVPFMVVRPEELWGVKGARGSSEVNAVQVRVVVVGGAVLAGFLKGASTRSSTTRRTPPAGTPTHAPTYLCLPPLELQRDVLRLHQPP